MTHFLPQPRQSSPALHPLFGQVENDRNSQQPSSCLLPGAGFIHTSGNSLAKLYKYIANAYPDKTWTAANLNKRRAILSISDNIPLDIVVGRPTHAALPTPAAAPSRFTTAALARTRAITPAAALHRQRAAKLRRLSQTRVSCRKFSLGSGPAPGPYWGVIGGCKQLRVLPKINRSQSNSSSSRCPETASGVAASSPPSTGITTPEIQRDSSLAK